MRRWSSVQVEKIYYVDTKLLFPASEWICALFDDANCCDMLQISSHLFDLLLWAVVFYFFLPLSYSTWFTGSGLTPTGDFFKHNIFILFSTRLSTTTYSIKCSRSEAKIESRVSKSHEWATPAPLQGSIMRYSSTNKLQCLSHYKIHALIIKGASLIKCMSKIRNFSLQCKESSNTRKIGQSCFTDIMSHAQVEQKKKLFSEI